MSGPFSTASPTQVKLTALPGNMDDTLVCKVSSSVQGSIENKNCVQTVNRQEVQRVGTKKTNRLSYLPKFTFFSTLRIIYVAILSKIHTQDISHWENLWSPLFWRFNAWIKTNSAYCNTLEAHQVSTRHDHM